MSRQEISRRVIVLGGGYAGLVAAKRLANQVCQHGVEVALVNASPSFVERPRLHQVATGQQVPTVSLSELLNGSGASSLTGWAESIDLDRREVRVETGSGSHWLTYDVLVYAVGSVTDIDSVPGVRQHAWALSSRGQATRLSAALGAGGRVVVCGGGLTGIEAATEIAETHPNLPVELVSRETPGDWLSARGRAHVRRALDRLGIEVRAGDPVAEVRDGELLLASGEELPFGTCVWAGGFAVPSLARESGLEVSDCGRVVVDGTLRSVSHPDVYAIGDAAAASGRWGDAMAYGCRTGGFMGPYAANAIADRFAGRTPKPFRFRYVHQCVSLGRRDALIQFVDPVRESPRRTVLTGRIAVHYKDIVLNGAIWTFRHPGPYLPRRRTPGAASEPRFTDAR